MDTFGYAVDGGVVADLDLENLEISNTLKVDGLSTFSGGLVASSIAVGTATVEKYALPIDQPTINQQLISQGTTITVPAGQSGLNVIMTPDSGATLYPFLVDLTLGTFPIETVLATIKAELQNQIDLQIWANQIDLIYTDTTLYIDFIGDPLTILIKGGAGEFGQILGFAQDTIYASSHTSTPKTNVDTLKWEDFTPPPAPPIPGVDDTVVLVDTNGVMKDSGVQIDDLNNATGFNSITSTNLKITNLVSTSPIHVDSTPASGNPYFLPQNTTGHAVGQVMTLGLGGIVEFEELPAGTKLDIQQASAIEPIGANSGVAYKVLPFPIINTKDLGGAATYVITLNTLFSTGGINHLYIRCVVNGVQQGERRVISQTAYSIHSSITWVVPITGVQQISFDMIGDGGYYYEVQDRTVSCIGILNSNKA